MLRTIAARVAPDTAKELNDHLVALHRATTEKGDYWAGVQREATALKDIANKLVPVLSKHEFNQADAKALAQAVIAQSTTGEDLDYSAAQQQTMALGSIFAAMRGLGFANEGQLKALDDALGSVYEAAANDQTYRPEKFAQALKEVEAKLP